MEAMHHMCPKDIFSIDIGSQLNPAIIIDNCGVGFSDYGLAYTDTQRLYIAWYNVC